MPGRVLRLAPSEAAPIVLEFNTNITNEINSSSAVENTGVENIDQLNDAAAATLKNGGGIITHAVALSGGTIAEVEFEGPEAVTLSEDGTSLT